MQNFEYTWQTAAIIRESADAVTIVFDTKALEFSYKAGQFLNVKCVIDGSAVSRSYSLCSAPGVDDRTAITVKRVEGGLMSAFICDYAEQISEWRVDGPHGLFHPNEGVVSSEDVVFVAGGSGITPVFSIIKYLLNHT